MEKEYSIDKSIGWARMNLHHKHGQSMEKHRNENVMQNAFSVVLHIRNKNFLCQNR